MKRARLLAVGLLVCASPCWTALGGDDTGLMPVMVDAANGWRLHRLSRGDTILGYVVEHTTDGGKHWQNVLPGAPRPGQRRGRASSFDSCPPALSVVDGREAWVQTDDASDDLPLEHTDDGGKHWQKKTAHLKAFKGEGMALAYTSFVDGERGFLLKMGEPAAGHMRKAVYATKDGGTRWQRLTGVPGGLYYPTGIVFRTREQGWVTGTNHGDPDVPFYRTVDGGEHWELQPLPCPQQVKGLLGGNTDPPVFTGPDKKRGQMRVNLTWKDAQNAEGQTSQDFTYETEDGGATWHLAAHSAT